MNDKFTCQHCGEISDMIVEINGIKYNMFSRKFCLKCSPFKSNNTRSYIIKTNDNEAYCVKCQKIKHKREFYVRKNSGRTFSYCMQCQKENKELKLQEKLERLIEEKNGCCEDCGQMFPLPVYEFYKDGIIFGMAKAKNMSLNRLKTKLEGFVMLCANCARIRKWEKKL